MRLENSPASAITTQRNGFRSSPTPAAANGWEFPRGGLLVALETAPPGNTATFRASWIGRFLIQWRHAERHGKSEFPPAFWWLTIAGSSLLAVYSLHRGDPPLIFGFVMSWVAPVRNLMLHHRHQDAST